MGKNGIVLNIYPWKGGSEEINSFPWADAILQFGLGLIFDFVFPVVTSLIVRKYWASLTMHKEFKKYEKNMETKKPITTGVEVYFF